MMKSWEYVDVFDSHACGLAAYEGYGIKLLKGDNHLSGRALQAEHDNLVEGMGSISMGSDSESSIEL